MRKLAITALALGLLVPAILSAVPVSAEEAADAPEFDIEAFLQVPTLTSPAISPDGDLVAYTRTWRDLELDKRLRQLWLAGTDGEEVRRLTFDDENTLWNVDWRPDGALSYISTRGGSAQVWVNPLDGGEPRAVTDLEDGVDSYWWSPDGKTLAVLSTTEAPDDEDEDVCGDEESGDTADVDDSAAADDDAAADEPQDEGDWTVFDRLEQPQDYAQLWIVAADCDGPAEADPRRLTESPLHPYHVAWSPDGTTLALTYNEKFSSLVDEEQRVGLVDVASGELTMISPPDRHASLAAFSPDGKALAYFVDREAGYRAYLNLKDLVVRDLAAGTEKVLTPDTQLDPRRQKPVDLRRRRHHLRSLSGRRPQRRPAAGHRIDRQPGGLRLRGRTPGIYRERAASARIAAFPLVEEGRQG